jgi:hypothetical protein
LLGIQRLIGLQHPKSLAEFYRTLLGLAGSEIPTTVVRDDREPWHRVKSADRGSFHRNPHRE